MFKLRQSLLGRLMKWQARRDGMTQAEIDSGLLVCSLNELKEYGVEIVDSKPNATLSNVEGRDGG